MADIKVSWLAFDTAATPVDVKVSWIAFDTAATPVDVRVSWLAFDTESVSPFIEPYAADDDTPDPIHKQNRALLMMFSALTASGAI